VLACWCARLFDRKNLEHSETRPLPWERKSRTFSYYFFAVVCVCVFGCRSFAFFCDFPDIQPNPVTVYSIRAAFHFLRLARISSIRNFGKWKMMEKPRGDLLLIYDSKWMWFSASTKRISYWRKITVTVQLLIKAEANQLVLFSQCAEVFMRGRKTHEHFNGFFSSSIWASWQLFSFIATDALLAQINSTEFRPMTWYFDPNAIWAVFSEKCSNSQDWVR